MSGENLAKESKSFGAFILPSHIEPWGVVVHEFAMAGLPIIASDRVGAADSFVINNYNGFVYNHIDETALIDTIKRLMTMSNEKLMEMGNRSHNLSKMQSPVIAAYSLMSIL